MAPPNLEEGKALSSDDVVTTAPVQRLMDGGDEAAYWARWAAGDFPPPQCHGQDMAYREGVSQKGWRWMGWFCTKGKTCSPAWHPHSGKRRGQ